MNVQVFPNGADLGRAAARHAAAILNEAIDRNGEARIVLSTGASQFDTLEHLIREDVDWSKVSAFHLDEYIGLSADHPASFRRYLKERFADRVPIGAMHYVAVEGDVEANIAALTVLLRQAPIDLAFIGIGENAHIAFNDPPADFDTKEAYIVVELDEACKRQQVGEGCFPSIDAVPKQAVTMTVHQIMQAKTILSCVPDKRKAQAVKLTLERELTNEVPATMLKRHADFHLYLDEQSASELASR